MRAIKFRGKSLTDGRWYYGDVVRDEKYTSIRFLVKNSAVEYVEITVIPETVGQFTGLTDKNGVDIYEGDILKASKHSDGMPIIVTYGSDASFNAFPFGSAYSASLYSRIIGNIHDNPELLK